jgi:hypothetical protein
VGLHDTAAVADSVHPWSRICSGSNCKYQCVIGGVGQENMPQS